MNIIWTSKQISQALNIKFSSQETFGRVHFNSQDVTKGDIFIALKGGARDGHDFVSDALERGAGIAIVSQDVKDVPVDKVIKVEDTFVALQDFAEYKRHKSKACFIGITGSVGKTSTKKILGLVLESFGKTFISRGNFNNQIGVPINLASIADDDKFIVIEMGMSSAGEISRLTKQVMPDIAMITSVAEGHLEFFDSIEKIADAKSEIFEGLDINSGVAILNRDISTYRRCIENIDIAGVGNIETFGKSQFANVRLVSYSLVDLGMVRLVYSIFNEKLEFVMPAIPKHIATNFAAVLTVIHTLALDVTQAAKVLATFKTRIGRGSVVKVTKDNKEYSIITDYYNANPESMKAGLEHLRQFKNTQKIAILGDMKELGVDELKIHHAMIPYIVKSGIKKLFLVGDIMPQIIDDIPKTIVVYGYKTSDDLNHDINKYIEGGEVVLIKGSRSIHLEKVAENLGVINAL
ncbi:MAG: UDP-N-acetylmuramoyl-tripeptide--D-alanyl-D-alanine ligase [Rickettsiaceae bacterium]